jgi:uncharacterized protein YggE
MKRTFLILTFIAASAALAQPAPQRDTVSVSGMARSSVVPDHVTFNVTVQTVGQTVDEAVNENNTKVAAVLAALKKAGATDRDVRTSNFSIYPQQDYQQGKLPRILGYNVSNSITVTRPNPAEASKMLQVAINAGVNQSSGLSFEVSDPTRGRDGAGGRTDARSGDLDQRRLGDGLAAAPSIRHGDGREGSRGERGSGRGRGPGEHLYGCCCVRIALINQWFRHLRCNY